MSDLETKMPIVLRIASALTGAGGLFYKFGLPENRETFLNFYINTLLGWPDRPDLRIVGVPLTLASFAINLIAFDMIVSGVTGEYFPIEKYIFDKTHDLGSSIKSSAKNVFTYLKNKTSRIDREPSSLDAYDSKEGYTV